MKKIICSICMVVFSLFTFNQSSYADFTPTPSNLIPAMTGHKTPSGEAFASSEYHDSYGDSYAWEAFDHINEDHYKGEWGPAFPFSGTPSVWIGYKFNTPTIVNKYTITTSHYTYANRNAADRAPKSWEFQGSIDGENWTTLDEQVNIVSWGDNITKEFKINNNKAFAMYRVLVKESVGGTELSIGEIEMMFEQTDNENPIPEPIGDRAILVIMMTTGLEKEYDLSMDEVNAFINWYDAKDAGSGPSKYAIDKHGNNKGPFIKRTDYVIFNNILTFEINEYNLGE